MLFRLAILFNTFIFYIINHDYFCDKNVNEIFLHILYFLSFSFGNMILLLWTASLERFELFFSIISLFWQLCFENRLNQNI